MSKKITQPWDIPKNLSSSCCGAPVMVGDDDVCTACCHPCARKENTMNVRELAQLIIAKKKALDEDDCHYPDDHYACYIAALNDLVEAAEDVLREETV